MYGITNPMGAKTEAMKQKTARRVTSCFINLFLLSLTTHVSWTWSYF